MYDSAPPRRYRYLLTWRMRINSDVVAAAGRGGGQPGEQHERASRRLPLLVVRRREGTEVPAFGAEVAAPPIGLQPGRGDGSTVAHDVHVARAGKHTVDEAGAGPTGELVQEQRCAL